ncbi:MAG: undecaprenyl/decaprenyl-phosphate alpha-N-acetylglucosaminyl 1-phosphate transferase [Acidobacteriia bacterium]|nr:undecaprenyl/decaprenyl-phosphate alpha-N-acetylglucosaminyl 1-phosphate transferase [Terriglobia bacterium]
MLSLVLTPLVRDCLGHLGFLDHPDGIRKKHSGPVPRVGGVAIALSYATTFAIALALPLRDTRILHEALPGVVKLTLVASVVLLTGLVDDLVGLTAWKKLAGTGAAAVLAYFAGIRVDLHLFPAISAYPWLGFAVTIAWLVGCTNAFNLIDGMDGLASGVGLFASMTVLVAALTQPNFPLALATIPLAGCLLGFLRYNFSPASVFLGDGGSLLIGFLLACYGTVWSQKSVTLVAMMAPLLAVSIPLVDVTLSILRRYLCRRPIFEGDRGHIHHKLLDRGFSPKGAVLAMYGVCCLAAIASLLLNAYHNEFGGLIIVLLCVPAWLGIQYLGYTEFANAGRILFKGEFRRIIDAETRLQHFEAALAKADNVGECWTRILEGSRDFGFQGVRMSVAGAVFEESNGWTNRPVWQLRIPLAESQYINFVRDFEAQLDPFILSAFVNCVERGVKKCIAGYEPELERIETAPARLVYAARAVSDAAANGSM